MKTLTTDERERLHDIVCDLFANDFLWALDCPKRRYGYGYEHQVESWLNSHFDYLKEIHCRVTSGATRVVVIPEGEDWVLKFGFNDPSLIRDYNRLEAQNYAAATNRGLEDFFAASYYFEEVCGVDIYVQEHVWVDDDAVSDSFYNYTIDNFYSHRDLDDDRTQEEAWEDSYSLDNEDRVYAMLGDQKRVDDLVNFINAFEINDLHSANWGYRDEQPVLIDYSGY